MHHDRGTHTCSDKFNCPPTYHSKLCPVRIDTRSASTTDRDTRLARLMPRYSTLSSFDYTTTLPSHLSHRARQHAFYAISTASDVHVSALLILQTCLRLLWTNTRDPAGVFLPAMTPSALSLLYS